jgi:adenosylcobyric acid synthase
VNLRDRDLANMGLARALGLPTVVVGDIDRGGVLAAMLGTLAALEREDQALIAGFVVNKFRGDVRLLQPGLDWLTARTARPVLGVLPWVPGLWLDVEDSLDLDSRPATAAPALGEQTLRVSVVRLPRLSNVTDIDALSAEPGVLVRFAAHPDELADADLVVLPGTRATVEDLEWLRAAGLADAIVRRARAGGQTIGICGGFQMLGRTISDEVESRRGTVAGLGLLPVDVRFAADKTLGRPTGTALGAPVIGYEIHHGLARVDGGEPFLDGCVVGSVWGTSWHGAFENDEFRRRFLARVAGAAGRRFVPAPATVFAEVRARRLDALGDLVAEHLDTAAILRLIERGAPPDLPAMVSHLA